LPTITTPAMTQAGLILGTAAYMAPEQARGRPVNKQADIWAFGVVLWEMVTGERLFKGEDLTETLASVVKDEPDWPRVPPRVRGVLRACLEKDPRKRLRDIGDVWRLLEDEPQAVASATPSKATRPAWMVAGASALVATAAVALALGLGGAAETPPQELVRFDVAFPAGMTHGGRSVPALSPDGRRLAFVAEQRGQRRIFVHALDGEAPQPLQDTDGAFGAPFWSPDSRFLVFATGNRYTEPGPLKKIDVTGGPALTIAQIASTVRGGFWTRDGTIVFSVAQQGLFTLPASGGEPRRLLPVGTRDEGYAPAGRPAFPLREGRTRQRQNLRPVAGRRTRTAGGRGRRERLESGVRTVCDWRIRVHPLRAGRHTAGPAVRRASATRHGGADADRAGHRSGTQRPAVVLVHCLAKRGHCPLTGGAWRTVADRHLRSPRCPRGHNRKSGSADE
jgi:hypothetical protein